MKPQPIPTVKTDRQILLDAADLIRTRGWWDGRLVQSRPEGYCALTAIAWTGGIRAMYATDRFRDYIGGTDIPVWNDARTAEEVISALEDCALSLPVE